MDLDNDTMLPVLSPVDIVIPYVDGNVVGYREHCLRHTGEFKPCHVRPLGELRYVLRTIDQHLPWANLVLVVQDERHIPDWLNRDSVRIVLHEQYIPQPLLPTFHWATIMAHMHLIPEISNKFIVWDDDVLVKRDLQLSDFFADNDSPRLDLASFFIVPGLERIPRFGTYQKNLAHTRQLLRREHCRCGARGLPPASFIFPHIPVPVNRALWKQQFDSLMADDVYRDTLARKSRGNEIENPTIDPIVAYANWVQNHVNGRGTARLLLDFLKAQMPLNQRSFAKLPILSDLRQTKRSMQRLLSGTTTFININDEAYEGLSPETHACVTEALERLAPQISRFEMREI